MVQRGLKRDIGYPMYPMGHATVYNVGYDTISYGRIRFDFLDCGPTKYRFRRWRREPAKLRNEATLSPPPPPQYLAVFRSRTLGPRIHREPRWILGPRDPRWILGPRDPYGYEDLGIPMDTRT